MSSVVYAVDYVGLERDEAPLFFDAAMQAKKGSNDFCRCRAGIRWSELKLVIEAWRVNEIFARFPDTQKLNRR